MAKDRKTNIKENNKSKKDRDRDRGRDIRGIEKSTVRQMAYGREQGKGREGEGERNKRNEEKVKVRRILMGRKDRATGARSNFDDEVWEYRF